MPMSGDFQPKNSRPIPVGVTNRHLHISLQDLWSLFGKGYELTRLRDISQKGQFAANETVTAIGPAGRIEGIRIVGPPRSRTQLEISPADAHRLGIAAPVRYSGDLDGTPGVTLQGPAGAITLQEGVIIPQRHIHMSPQDARSFGVTDGARVMVAAAPPTRVNPRNETRRLIFDNVLIRVHSTFVLDFHIDTDEANAAGLRNGDTVYIVGMSPLAAQLPPVRWLTEHDVRRAILARRKIRITPKTRMTPAARDLGKAHDVFILEPDVP